MPVCVDPLSGNYIVVADGLHLPAAGDLFEGLLVYRQDNNSLSYWDGAAWVVVGSGGGGGGGGSSTFAGDTDVLVSGLADWDLIRFSASNAKYVNSPLSSAPSFVSLSNTVASNTAAINAFSNASSVIGKRSPGTAINNATTVASDLYAGDAGISWVGDDSTSYIGSYIMANQNTVGGAAMAFSWLTKWAGINSLQGSFTLAAGGAGTYYLMDIFMETVAGADTNHHVQKVRFKIYKAAALAAITGSNSVFAYGVAVDSANSNVLDVAGMLTSTATAYGTTRPSGEVRINMQTLDANCWLQRLDTMAMFIKDR